MLVVRRVYLYLVAAISLIAVTWSVIGLTRLIISEGIGEGQIIGLASLMAVIIVGLPIYLFHWLMAQRLVANSQEEWESPVRVLYFYGIMAAGAVPVISNIYRLLDNLLLNLVGGIRYDYYPYDLTAAEHFIAIVMWAVIFIYHWRLSRPLVNRQSEATLVINLGIRRFYLLAFSLGGLVMVSWGGVGLLQTLMQISTGVLWQTPIADYSAQLLVGTVVWVAHWLLLQRDFAGGHPVEERSVLRKIYIYLAVFVYSIITLGSGTMLLKRLLELALGAPPSQEPLLSQLSVPVPLLVVGGLFWAYHWWVLKQDIRQAPVVPRQAGVRRIYAYLVAAIGLTVTLTGVVGLLTLLIDMLMSSASVGLDYYREQTALFVAMTIVGTPVWLLPWRVMQRLALPPASVTERSADERRSVVRKIYLYLFVFIASLSIFGSVGWFVFHILTWLLGADLPADFSTELLYALVISLLAIGVWLYHWQAIRRDGQLEQQDQSHRLADITVVVIDGDAGTLGQRVVHHLERELPGLKVKPVGLTNQAREAMIGHPFSATVLETAHYIIGSWQTLTAADVAPLVAANPAVKFAIPLADNNWLWAGLKSQSLDYYAAQITQGLKQAIEGEDINFNRGMDVGNVIAIVAGVVLFLCVGSSIVGAALSLLRL